MPHGPEQWSALTEALLRAALAEDLADGDITAALLPRPDEVIAGRVVARSPGVLSGLALLPLLMRVYSDAGGGRVEVCDQSEDGEAFEAGALLATLAGPRAAVLALERTLLNFLGRMSGVATLTAAFVQAAAVREPAPRIYDTRKTIPGWRELDKYAVRCGGGHNHRFGLYDAVLIKDNHLAGIAVADLPKTLVRMIATIHGGSSAGEPQNPGRSPKFIEVEVDSLEQLEQVLTVDGIDIVLIDNFTPGQMREAVARRDAAGLRGKVELEASGGVTLASVAAIAATGVERIAVGALTHSALNLDLGLDL